MVQRAGWEKRRDIGLGVFVHPGLRVLVQQDVEGLWWVFLLDEQKGEPGGHIYHDEGYHKLMAAMAWGEAWARFALGGSESGH